MTLGICDPQFPHLHIYHRVLRGLNDEMCKNAKALANVQYSQALPLPVLVTVADLPQPSTPT